MAVSRTFILLFLLLPCILPDVDAGEDFQSFSGLMDALDKLKSDQVEMIVIDAETAAENGSMYAQSLLSSLYYDGYIKERDYNKAFYWAQRASEQGELTSIYQMGDCYRLGHGTEMDPVKAYDYFKRCHDVALKYIDQYGPDSKERKIVQYFLALASLRSSNLLLEHNNESTFIEEYHRINGSREFNGEFRTSWDLRQEARQHIEKRGIEWMKIAANNNNMDAQYRIGRWFREGGLVERNPTEAENWLRKAAKQGSLDAKIELGNVLKDKNDFEGSVALFREAAEAGDPIAQYNVGIMLLNGFGIEKDILEADRYFTEAEKNGYEKSTKIRRAIAPQVRKLINQNSGIETITINEFFRAYHENELAAELMFEGSRMEIIGEVAEVAKRPADGAMLTLRTIGDAKLQVQCLFNDDQIKSLVQLKRGDLVAIQGVCRGASKGSELLTDGAPFFDACVGVANFGGE